MSPDGPSHVSADASDGTKICRSREFKNTLFSYSSMTRHLSSPHFTPHINSITPHINSIAPPTDSGKTPQAQPEMPTVGPYDVSLTKSLENLAISVSYSQVPISPTELDCAIEFRNTAGERRCDVDRTSPDTSDSEDGGLARQSRSGKIQGEKTHVARAEPEAASLFLGYVQLVGYVRVNHKIGGSGTAAAARDVFWKNQSYAGKYPVAKEQEKVEAILQTPFFTRHECADAFKNKFAGWPDFKSGEMDSVSTYLLHDLAHTFNSREPPPPGASAPNAQEVVFLTSEFPQSIVPFYVTSQHLLFSSTRIDAGCSQTNKIRISIPDHTLPPSYNTGLTGYLGDNGLVSICYQFVVGLLKESLSGMASRSVFFPLEFVPSQIRTERGWLQADFLQRPVVDKNWRPRVVTDAVNIPNGNAGDAEKSGRRVEAAKSKLAAEIDSLIHSSVETVAAKERCRSLMAVSRKDSHRYIPQMPRKPRVSYQIMANGQSVCVALMSKATYSVGEDIHFCLDLPVRKSLTTRVVGAVVHVEAHEVFHSSETDKPVNAYKVTPSVKLNTYTCALAISDDEHLLQVASILSLPTYLAPQFQASTLMDLKYVLVFSLVLNEFDAEHHISSLDYDDTVVVADYIQKYEESEFHEFKFFVPLTVLP